MLGSERGARPCLPIRKPTVGEAGIDDGGSASCGLGLDFYAFLTEFGKFDHANDNFALQHVFIVLLSPKLREIML